jgi:hypothetical protein
MSQESVEDFLRRGYARFNEARREPPDVEEFASLEMYHPDSVYVNDANDPDPGVHRGIDAVTENHIYTCFKSMDWSTNIPNFAQPLRDLKAKQQVFEKSDKGYEINHIGIDFVKKLTRKGE